MAEKKIAVGILGLGRSGWGIHARTIRNPAVAEKFQVVAVTDPITARMDEAKDVFGCRTYGSVDELLQDKEVELVVVATFNHQHADHSIAAMRAGKDVLCEKPMASKLADADRMIQARDETGRVLTFNHNKRYSPDFLVVQDVLQSGKLGEILLIRIAGQGFRRRWDWQTLKSHGGGEMNNNAAHAVDAGLTLLSVLGADADPEVFCDVRKTPLCAGDADDHVKIVLRTKGGPTVDVEVTNAAAIRQDSWYIMGTQGGLTGGAQELRWRYFNPRLLPERQATAEPTPDRSYNREDVPWQEESWQKGEEKTTGYDMLYLDLYETLRHGAPLAITPESVRKQIAIFEECRRQSPV